MVYDDNVYLLSISVSSDSNPRFLIVRLTNTLRKQYELTAVRIVCVS